MRIAAVLFVALTLGVITVEATRCHEGTLGLLQPLGRIPSVHRYCERRSYQKRDETWADETELPFGMTFAELELATRLTGLDLVKVFSSASSRGRHIRPHSNHGWEHRLCHCLKPSKPMTTFQKPITTTNAPRTTTIATAHSTTTRPSSITSSDCESTGQSPSSQFYHTTTNSEQTTSTDGFEINVSTTSVPELSSSVTVLPQTTITSSESTLLESSSGLGASGTSSTAPVETSTESAPVTSTESTVSTTSMTTIISAVTTPAPETATSKDAQTSEMSTSSSSVESTSTVETSSMDSASTTTLSETTNESSITETLTATTSTSESSSTSGASATGYETTTKTSRETSSSSDASSTTSTTGSVEATSTTPIQSTTTDTTSSDIGTTTNAPTTSSDTTTIETLTTTTVGQPSVTPMLGWRAALSYWDRNTGLSLVNDDDGAYVAVLPWETTLGGVTNNTLHISVNGFISLQYIDAAYYRNYRLPTSNILSETWMVYWDDLEIVEGRPTGIFAAIVSGRRGDKNRVAQIEWLVAPRRGPDTEYWHMIAEFYEASPGKVTYRYYHTSTFLSYPVGFNNYEYGTIGVQSLVSGEYQQYSYNQVPDPGLEIVYDYTPTTSTDITTSTTTSDAASSSTAGPDSVPQCPASAAAVCIGSIFSETCSTPSGRVLKVTCGTQYIGDLIDISSLFPRRRRKRTTVSNFSDCQTACDLTNCAALNYINDDCTVLSGVSDTISNPDALGAVVISSAQTSSTSSAALSAPTTTSQDLPTSSDSPAAISTAPSASDGQAESKSSVDPPTPSSSSTETPGPLSSSTSVSPGSTTTTTVVTTLSTVVVVVDSTSALSTSSSASDLPTASSEVTTTFAQQTTTTTDAPTTTTDTTTTTSDTTTMTTTTTTPGPAPMLPTAGALTGWQDGAASVTVDDANYSLQIPFSVNVLGKTSNKLYISINGWVSLASTNYNAATNYQLPTDYLPNAAYAPYWDDLEIIAGRPNGIFYQVTGTTGQRVVTIEWLVSPRRGRADQYWQFTLTLSEATPRIPVFKYYHTSNYLSSMDGYANSQYGTIGMQNYNAGNSVQYSIGQVPQVPLTLTYSTSSGSFVAS